MSMNMKDDSLKGGVSSAFLTGSLTAVLAQTVLREMSKAIGYDTMFRYTLTRRWWRAGARQRERQPGEQRQLSQFENSKVLSIMYINYSF